MATKREQQRLTPTRAMDPLTCELSDRIDVQLPSLIRDPPLAKDPKRTRTTVSLSDLEELQKNFLSNHVLLSHRSHDEVLHLAYMVSSLF
jgi:hypothetical protein